MSILANSASVTMTSGAADFSKAGYIAGEQIVLSTAPAGTTHRWSLAKPSTSRAGSVLSSTDDPTVTLTPDVAGYYTLHCLVDGVTSYVLRLSVTQVAVTTAAEAWRTQPKLTSAVPTPSTGVVKFWGLNEGALLEKHTSGLAFVADRPGEKATAALTDADASKSFNDGYVHVLPNGVLTANRQLTVNVTGGTAGEMFELHRLDGEAFTYTVVNGGIGGGTLHTCPVSARQIVRLRYDGTNMTLHEVIRL